MALSLLRSKNLHHGHGYGRSFSLPSNLQHSAKITTLSSSIENTTLNGLKNLFCNIDDLLMLPRIQQIIARECHDKSWVFDLVVDAYIRLLDACTMAKDAVSQTKNDVQQLLSALRRKDTQSYQQSSSKNSKKMIQKGLKELRSLKSTKQSDLFLKKDQETVAVVYMIREAESVTITVFENLLSRLIIGNNVQPKQNGWSLVSNLIMPTNKASQKCEETVDPSQLKEMELNIQILEQELESLFRQLIRTRVFLLNILNN